ncbi:YbaB/EbfC family nucleoid-associated protein [Nocardioides currus]|uniref:YbaB/EbfC family DNA-binding protein n=1 Tax=Nocardioides currus TaxID=2133958 RepID=A0A2R7YXZ5_9ACTN|nr:YbaB/EbfC family nucleoid-associated protein [Nocardioides currus]PUA81265.1 hypothetical protein C7S10_09545 [Nocardioides currus]
MTDTDPWLDDLHTHDARQLERIARLQADLAEVYGEGHTAHGRVHVRVNAAGRPTALTLEPTATSLPATELAAAILRAVDQAAGDAAARVASLLGDLVPADEVDAMLTGVPSPADRSAVREWTGGSTG